MEMMVLLSGVIIGAVFAGVLGVALAAWKSAADWWRRRNNSPRYVDVHSLRPDGFRRFDMDMGDEADYSVRFEKNEN